MMNGRKRFTRRRSFSGCWDEACFPSSRPAQSRKPAKSARKVSVTGLRVGQWRPPQAFGIGVSGAEKKEAAHLPPFSGAHRG
jgi:hypothetical protein